MKRILFILFLLSSVNLYSQVWIDYGAEWHYNFSTVGGTGGFIRINYTGDTLVNGVNCQKLISTQYTFGVDQFGNTYLMYISTSAIPNLTYSSGDTVFYYINNQFEVLYNFGAQPNDSWYTGVDTNGLQCSMSYTKVDSIGTININSQNLRWLALSPTSTSSEGLYGKANERFGNMEFYLFPQPQNCDTMMSACFDWITFSCYQDSSFALYNESLIDCEYLLSTNENNFINRKPFIYPNPTSGIITIGSFDVIKIVLIYQINQMVSILLNAKETIMKFYIEK